jgi:hypothetical protein
LFCFVLSKISSCLFVFNPDLVPPISSFTVAIRDYRNLANADDAEAFTFQGKKMLWMTEYPEQVCHYLNLLQRLTPYLNRPAHSTPRRPSHAQQITNRLYSLHKASHPGYGNHLRLTPTTGFRLFTALLSSNICSRIDLYGFSAEGGAKYHSPRATLGNEHIAGLEHWLYRLSMQELMRVCPYD